MARRGENIYKRRDGRWEGRYKCGFHANGRTKYRSVYARTYQEIKEKLSKLKTEPSHYVSSGKVTVKELFEEWLNAIRFRVKDSTLANYRMKFNKHILPVFGGIQYEQLTSASVHKFIESKINCHLSPKYVADIVVVFKCMAKYVSREHNYKNPLLNISMPQTPKKEMRLLSEDEQKKLCLFASTNTDKTKLGVLLSYYTGLRIGELCGLKWSDIDFENKTLSVRRTVQRITEKNGDKTTRLLVDTPKTQSSVRSIPLPTFLLRLLQEHKASCNSYVLSGTGSVIEPRTMQYRFQSLLKKANLPSINFHSLRHMFATNSIRLGFDVKTLSELLGHSSVETTLNRYVHSSMERKSACMNLIQAVA